MSELEILKAHAKAVFGNDAGAYTTSHETTKRGYSIAFNASHSVRIETCAESEYDACRKLSSMLVVLANAGWKP